MAYLPSRIVGTFGSNFDLTPRERGEMKRQGVTVTALDNPTPIRAGFVVFGNSDRFQFEQHLSLRLSARACRAFLVLIEDEGREATDIAAWAPGLGRLALWTGTGWALNQDRVLAPRISADPADPDRRGPEPAEPLQVWRDPLSWLQAGRRGIVLLQPKRGASILDDAGPLQAKDEAHGRELREVLTRRGPRILIPADARRAAA